MVSEAKRAEIIAQIKVLHQERLELLSDATFKGWTKETKAANAECLKRIAALNSELATLESNNTVSTTRPLSPASQKTRNGNPSNFD